MINCGINRKVFYLFSMVRVFYEMIVLRVLESIGSFVFCFEFFVLMMLIGIR